MKGRVVLLGLLFLTLLLATGCGTKQGAAPESAPAPVRGEGNPEVYDRMDTESCDQLRAEFDQAMDNYDATQHRWSLDYADYAEAVMKQIGCSSS